MTGMSQSPTGRRRRARPLVVFATLCAALIGLAAVSSAGAQNANVLAKSAKLLGKTKHTPPPSCPNRKHANRCQGVGRVTGFPLIADGVKRPFRVRRNGKLVAWSIDLSRPTKDQRNFFGSIFKGKKFGKAPSARIAVLEQNKRHRRKYKLLRQSPTVNLTGALGHKEIFTLDAPLRIRKGQMVALSYPSWASNFAHNHLSAHDNQWRASRSKRKCAPPNPGAVKRWARNSKSQQKVGGNRTYGCDYAGGRLLYWAYYVPR
jgi:hypothetical protein